MAKGFFNSISKNSVADSAGTQPTEKVDHVAVQVMKEKDVDISSFVPKMLTFSMNNLFDFIVTMGCINGCPITPKSKTIEWEIMDPKGKTIQQYRKIRDQIEIHVEKLIKETIEK
ncbi:MAG: hypothetical protein KAW47_06120 [Thermoplasmatales archaeon]|nr:hypothetical protein [Thermoplasmatales archaeon]